MESSQCANSDIDKSFLETFRYLFQFVKSFNPQFDQPGDYVELTTSGRLYNDFARLNKLLDLDSLEEQTSNESSGTDDDIEGVSSSSIVHKKLVATLLEQGAFDINQGMAETVSEMLQDKDPYYDLIHLRLMESLLRASAKCVSLEQVHEEIRSFPNYHSSRDVPFDLDDALMIWMHKASAKDCNEEYEHDLMDYVSSLFRLNSVYETYECSQDIKQILPVVPFVKNMLSLRHFATVLFEKCVLKRDISEPFTGDLRKGSVTVHEELDAQETADNEEQQLVQLDVSKVKEMTVSVTDANETNTNEFEEECDDSNSIFDYYMSSDVVEQEDVQEVASNIKEQDVAELDEKKNEPKYKEVTIDDEPVQEDGFDIEDYDDNLINESEQPVVPEPEIKEAVTATETVTIPKLKPMYRIKHNALPIVVEQTHDSRVISISAQNLVRESASEESLVIDIQDDEEPAKQSLEFISLTGDVQQEDSIDQKRKIILARLARRQPERELDQKTVESKQQFLKMHREILTAIEKGTKYVPEVIEEPTSNSKLNIKKTSNASVIKNALKQVMQSKLHAEALASIQDVMQSYNKQNSKADFVIYLKSSSRAPVYKGLYVLYMVTQTVPVLLRIHGGGPQELDDCNLTNYYKYSTSTRSLMPLETRNLSHAVHAIS